jgi:hypothetical protein
MWRLTRRRMATPPDPADVAAARILDARPGPGRRRIVSILVAQIGEKVQPAAPALDHPGRERWVENRKAELRRQCDLLRILSGRP